MSNCVIHIVEDNEPVREMMRTRFERREPKFKAVLISTSLAEALANIKKHKPDVTIWDLALPDSRPWNTILIALRARDRLNPGMGNIVQTGRDAYALEELSRTRGLDFYFIKPVRYAPLWIAIEHLYRQRMVVTGAPRSGPRS